MKSTTCACMPAAGHAGISASSAACFNVSNASSAAYLLFWFFLMSGILAEINVNTCYFGSGKVKDFS